MTTARLDRVFTFEDQLSFLIPHDWVEADEEGGNYLYHAPNTDSGWLRASLISIKRGCPEAELRSLLNERAQQENGRLYDRDDNIVVAWQKNSEEDGDPIVNFWWGVGHYHGPTLCHEALFSFTVLAERKEHPETVETVALLGELVAQARFVPPKVV